MISTTVQGVTVALTGTRAAGTIVASPNQVAFGSVAANTASAPQLVTLTNLGTANVTMTLSGMPATVRATPAVCTAVAPQQSCTVSLTFTPNSINTNLSSTINVNNVGLIRVTGSGAAVTFSPASLTFAPQPLFNASAPQTVTLRNGSTAALALGALSFAGTNPDSFARQGGTCGVNLASGRTCTIQVVFKPSAADAQSATLTIAGQSLALSGSGKYLVVSSSALNFIATVAGPNPPTQSLTVTNKGNTAVTGIAVTPSDPAFTANTNCINLASGASCNVSVVYNNPGSASTTSATLTITYDQVANTPESVSLTGVTQ